MILHGPKQTQMSRASYQVTRKLRWESSTQNLKGQLIRIYPTTSTQDLTCNTIPLRLLNVMRECIQVE